MSKDLENYEDIKDEIKAIYDEFLEKSLDNRYLIQAKQEIKEAIESLSISDEEKAKAIISLYTQSVEQTLSRTFDQALVILDKCLKLPKELEELDARVDLLQTQEQEVQESIKDRQTKRGPELNILLAQEKLILEQIEKLKKDTDFVITQKEKMIEQVIDNRIIKSMDSMGETISTIANGGVVVPKKLFEVYLELHNKLTGVSKDGDFSLKKM